ncbi:hypothetical protein C8R47DRAFT_1197194 [Mycena vitilis]|nr:hypothetical protein C8R47DRAFT_1197194 [Mycena vitilis]
MPSSTFNEALASMYHRSTGYIHTSPPGYPKLESIQQRRDFSDQIVWDKNLLQSGLHWFKDSQLVLRRILSETRVPAIAVPGEPSAIGIKEPPAAWEVWRLRLALDPHLPLPPSLTSIGPFKAVFARPFGWNRLGRRILSSSTRVLMIALYPLAPEILYGDHLSVGAAHRLIGPVYWQGRALPKRGRTAYLRSLYLERQGAVIAEVIRPKTLHVRSCPKRYWARRHYPPGCDPSPIRTHTMESAVGGGYRVIIVPNILAPETLRIPLVIA